MPTKSWLATFGRPSRAATITLVVEAASEQKAREQALIEAKILGVRGSLTDLRPMPPMGE